MKIILLQDVKKVGKKGEIIEANDGYARNYIIPQKLGIEATGKNLNDLKLQKNNQEKIAKEQLEAAQKMAEELKEKVVVVKIKAGEGGRVFGSVSSKEIAAELLKQEKIDIDKKKIQVADPIKAFGFHEVSVKLHPQVTGVLRVKVEEA